MDEALAGYDALLSGSRLSGSAGAVTPEQSVAAEVSKAVLLAELGRPGEAVTVYDQAVTVYQEVVAEHTRRPGARSRVQATVALRRVSDVLERLGRHDEAIAAHDHGVE